MIAALLVALAANSPAHADAVLPPFTECPAVGLSATCAVVIISNADGSTTVNVDPSVGPYDGSDDTLVGIVNGGTSPIDHVTVSSSSTALFGFDGDGICSAAISPQPAGCPFGPTGYEGPSTSFAHISADTLSGDIDFSPPLAPGGTAYASLEGPPTAFRSDCITSLTGHIEATQGVWQDDPLFGDGPGRQLDGLDASTTYGELPMIVNRPTLLFGADHVVGEAAGAHDRHKIVISGTSTGTTSRPTLLHVFGVPPGGAGDATVALDDRTAPITPSSPLDEQLYGPCDPAHPHPFHLEVSVASGFPSTAAFKITTPGAYLILGRLEDTSGNPASKKTIGTGGVAKTFAKPLLVTVYPAIFSAAPAAATTSLTSFATTLATDLGAHIGDLYPLPAGGSSVTVTGGSLLDLAKPLKDELDRRAKIRFTWQLPTNTAVEQIVREETARLVALGPATIGAPTSGRRTVLVVRDADWEAIGGSPNSPGFTVSATLIFVKESSYVSWYTLAHELVHTLPFGYLPDASGGDCGKDYHDNGAAVAEGFQITDAGVEHRAEQTAQASIMGGTHGRWIDQCTYAHLAGVLTKSSTDPLTTVVAGYLGKLNSTHKPGGRLDPSYQAAGIADLGSTGSGPYAIVFRDRTGKVLARFPFASMTETSDNGKADARNLVYFLHRVPVVAGAAVLELDGPGGVLDRRTFATSPPTLHLTAPVGGAAVKPGVVTLTWAGGGPAKAMLMYSAFASTNGGATWKLYSLEQTATSIKIGTARGQTVMWKVVASDGTRSVLATSAFVVH
jgi:hypothetical protein